MKKLSVLLLFFALAQTYFAQSLQFYTGKRDFLPIEILMEDGTTKTGFAQDFMLPDVATFTYLTKSSEKSANLARKEVNLNHQKVMRQFSLFRFLISKA